MSNQVMEARFSPALEKNLCAIKNFMQTFNAKEMGQLALLALTNANADEVRSTLKETASKFYKKIDEFGKAVDAVLTELE